MTGLLTYTDSEYSDDLVADYHDGTDTFASRYTDSATVNSYNLNYRLELGLRSMVTERLECSA